MADTMTDLQAAARVGHGSRHLILGGCGFIGREVARQLADSGATVVLADIVPPQEPFDPRYSNRISYRPFELRNADWTSMLQGVDVVHHYAWTSIPASANADPAGDLSSNVLPTIALLDAMRHLAPNAPRLVFTSSGGTVYGKLRQVPVHEDHPLQPITAYGASKAAAELYLSQYRTMYGLDCRIARLANPFGAGQNLARGQGAASAFLHNALNGMPIEIWGDGEVTRDYIHISDAASGLIALGTQPIEDGPSTFNIGSGKGISLNGIVAEIEERLGRPLMVKRLPGRAFDVPVSVLNIGLAADVLKWLPRLSFSEGMARTIEQLTAEKKVR